MDFSIFVWGIACIFFLFSGSLTCVFQNISFLKPIRYNYLYLIGLVVSGIIIWFYIPSSMQNWIALNNIILPYIQQYKGNNSMLLPEVWYTIVFFRNMWPGVFVALIMIAIDSSSHPISARYRMMHKFSHNKLLIMVGFLFAYFSIKHIDSESSLSTIFLGLTVYTAVYYWRFGFATILYILKKNKIPYELGIIFLVGSIIIVGEYFFLPLVLCIGIGISDIWMDYHHRNAAAMVFSLDFNK